MRWPCLDAGADAVCGGGELRAAAATDLTLCCYLGLMKLDWDPKKKRRSTGRVAAATETFVID